MYLKHYNLLPMEHLEKSEVEEQEGFATKASHKDMQR